MINEDDVGCREEDDNENNDIGKSNKVKQK